MTILNTFLEETAKAIAGDSFVYPTHGVVGTTSITVNVTDTSLDGEIGTRMALTGTRIGSQLQFNGLRLSTDVVDTGSGDSLKAHGIASAVTGGTLFTEQAPFNILHTTAFEIEFINNVIIRRA